MPQILVRAAVDVPVWKSITIGTFADSFALRNALDAVGCSIGDSAGEILARPAFTLSATKTNVKLFAVSGAELDFQTDTASLVDIYARANQLGFGLAAAEVAPQLRLQYFDQPIGEFLIIGMEPIKTWKGEPVLMKPHLRPQHSSIIDIPRPNTRILPLDAMSQMGHKRTNTARRY